MTTLTRIKMQQQIRGRLAHALFFLRHDGRHFIQFVWERFQQDRLTVTAGYLAYVTLLSLVPMIAVVTPGANAVNRSANSARSRAVA